MAPLTRRQLKAVQAVSRRQMRSLLAAIAVLCLVVSGGVWASAALPGDGHEAAPANAGPSTTGPSAFGPSGAAGSATAIGPTQAGPSDGADSGLTSEGSAGAEVQGDQSEKGLLWFFHFEQIEKLLDRGSPVEIPTPTLVAGVRGSEQSRRPDPGPPVSAPGPHQGPADQGRGPAVQSVDSSDRGGTVPDMAPNLSSRPQPVVVVAPESAPVNDERSGDRSQPTDRGQVATEVQLAGLSRPAAEEQARGAGRSDTTEKVKDGGPRKEKGEPAESSVIAAAETPVIATTETPVIAATETPVIATAGPAMTAAEAPVTSAFELLTPLDPSRVASLDQDAPADVGLGPSPSDQPGQEGRQPKKADKPADGQGHSEHHPQ